MLSHAFPIVSSPSPSTTLYSTLASLLTALSMHSIDVCQVHTHSPSFAAYQISAASEICFFSLPLHDVKSSCSDICNSFIPRLIPRNCLARQVPSSFRNSCMFPEAAHLEKESNLLERRDLIFSESLYECLQSFATTFDIFMSSLSSPAAKSFLRNPSPQFICPFFELLLCLESEGHNLAFVHVPAFSMIASNFP